MEATNTEALRSSAAHWSLAGDTKLLQLLQEIHEKVVTRCKETNGLLDQMATSLDETSIDVQSVNNKFMSLSNSQFVESRVYGDDADVSEDPVKQMEEPKPPDSPLSKTKQSLQVLERMHDAVEIYDDTDTESDTDDMVSSTVLKPKNVYADRPLPYIIGSYDWRTKWHVGLIREPSDSDTDSDAGSGLPKPEYSDTESEREQKREHSRTLSSSSESTPSSHEAPHAPPLPQVQSPADIASELARRLGNVGQRAILTEGLEPPKMIPGKIYRPDQPTVAAIFPEEPPPLDETISDDTYEDEEENDIFAELHNEHRAKDTARQEQRQIMHRPVKQASTLFEDDSEPELFAPKSEDPKIQSVAVQIHQDEIDNSVKKPIGGISLFGNSKGAESIGAAILKRNQRKLSSSDEDSDNNQAKHETITKERNRSLDKSEVKTTEKDIFENLFSKAQTKNAPVQKEQPKPAIAKKEEKKKIDLFNDDLFDDIDDIFTTDVVKSVPNRKVEKPKSLFDDGDDIFTSVSTSNPVKDDYKNNDMKKQSLFDSDEEIFTENTNKNTRNPIRWDNVNSKVNIAKKKGLFDSDDELSDNQAKASRKEDVPKKGNKTKQSNEKSQPIANNKISSIFGDSSDDDNIFDKIVVSKPVRETAIISDHTHILTHNEQNFMKTEKELDINTKNKTETTKYNNNEQIKITTSIISDNDNLNNNSDVQNLHKEVSNIQKDCDTESKMESLRSPSLFGDNDEEDVKPFISKESPQNDNNNPEDSLQNTNLLKQEALVSEIDVINKDIAIPKVTNDVKITSHVIVEATPYKTNAKESMENITVDDSWLEDDFVSDNDFDNSQVNSTHEFTTVTKSALTANNTQSQDLQENTQPAAKVPTQAKHVEMNNENEPYIHSTFQKSEAERNDQHTHENEEKPNKATEINDSDEILKIVFMETESKSRNYDKLFTDEPPEFEKPKEPKKSKNINALFDDDSDDEALFFKKSDAQLSDEKSEITPSSLTNKNLFGIFQDEPPDLTFDFGQKDEKSIKSKTEDKPIDGKNNNSLLERSQNSVQPSQENDKSKQEEKETEVKKPIGRIKSHLNINVNTLLPGASPKKVIKVKENTETLQSTNTSTEELDSKSSYIKPDDPKVHVMTRSVSFEDSPDAKVLDNTLSKERPRIQVKRRPSTRKARHEAVRKSVIDIYDDSTDNSSSIDDTSTSKPSETPDLTTIQYDNDVLRSQNEDIKRFEQDIDEPVIQVDDTVKEFRPELSEASVSASNKDVKSKLVYILNDEDIFTSTVPTVESDNTKPSKDIVEDTILDTKSIEFKDSDLFIPSITAIENEPMLDVPKVPNTIDAKPMKEQNKKPILNIVDDDDDDLLFKGAAFKDIPSKSESKLNVNKTENKQRSIFDDLSDDENDLFKPKKTNFTKPKTLFGSDSDDDIFVSKKNETERVGDNVEKREQAELKQSLFSDDEDDDLFGIKSNTDSKTNSSSSKETIITKRSKIALEDPLSMTEEDF